MKNNIKLTLILTFCTFQTMAMDGKFTNSIFSAMSFYEREDYSKAAEIFQRYAGRPVPVAEPYCLELVKKGFLKSFQPIPTNNGDNEISNRYFSSSEKFIKLKLVNKGELNKVIRVAERDKNGHLLYLIGTLFENGTTQINRNPLEAKKLYMAAIEWGSLRSVFSLKRLLGDSILSNFMFYEMPFTTIYKCLSLVLLSQMDEGEIFASLSNAFQANSQKTYPIFITYAAQFGHAQAQFRKAQYHCENSTQTLYWMMQASEHGTHGNLLALSVCGHMFERGEGTNKDYDTAYAYLKRAAHHPQARDIEFSNFGLCHEEGKGTPTNFKKACKWYERAYIANTTQESEVKDDLPPLPALQFVYNYGRALFLNNEYEKSLPLLIQSREFSDDACHDYGVLLEKLVQPGGDFSECEKIFHHLALKGHIDGTKNILLLISQSKIIPSSQNLLIYKSIIENIIANKEKLGLKKDKLAFFYNGLRFLKVNYDWLFSEDERTLIDFSRLALQTDPTNPVVIMAYAADLKDIGKPKEALDLFLSLEERGVKVSFNRIGACYDLLGVNEKETSKKIELNALALSYYEKELADPEAEIPEIAAFNIYSLYTQNRITAPNQSEKIIQYLRLAAEGGDAHALNDLGVCYMLGKYGLNIDVEKAEVLLKKAVLKGIAKSKMSLFHLKITHQMPQAMEEVKQLFDELWEENTEFSNYIQSMIKQISALLRHSYIETDGDVIEASEEISEEFNEEENWEQWTDWKQWEEKKQDTKKDVTSTIQELTPFSNNQTEEQGIKDHILKKYERMMNRVEKLQTKKQAKYRKVRTLIGQHMIAFGGDLKNGSGSGRRIQLGNNQSGFHTPHGNNGTEIKGGAMQSLINLMSNQHDKK